MKKILMMCGAAVAMVAATASCGSSSSSEPKTADDSINCVIGEFSGSQLNQSYASLPDEMKGKFNKAEILKGLKDVLMTDTTKQSYVTGMQIGLQLWGQLYQMESSGIKVDRKMVYDAYAKAFNADSVGDMSVIAARYQTAMSSVQKRIMQAQEEKAAAEAAARENSPEAKKNVADGTAYVNKMKKEDPSIKTTESGLSYKVITEGNGAKPDDSATVNVKYVGKHIDGKEFDSNDNAKFPVRGVIPGFAEGLKLMGQGAHYILYIPGKLAYGVDGTPDGSIGPNETLVFDVEVLGIENAK